MDVLQRVKIGKKLGSSNLVVGAVDSEESGGRVRRVLRHRSSNGKEGGLGMGKDPSKAEWRGLVEFNGDRGGGGGICRVFVVGDSAGNKEKTGGGRDGFGRQRGEVRGGGDSRAGWHVGEKPGVGPKEQRQSEDVTGEQVGGEGGGKFENWAHLVG